MNDTAPAPSDELEALLAEGRRWFVPDCRKTIALMEELQQRAEATSRMELVLEAQLLRVHSLWALSELEAAHRILDEAEGLASRQNIAAMSPRIANLRAELHLAAAEYPLALKYWSQCLKQATALQLTALYVPACLGLGNIFVAHGQHDMALTWHEQALDFAEREQDVDNLANCLLHLCADFNKLGEFTTTLLLSESREAILRQCNHPAWLGDWYSYRGHAHHGLGQLGEAEQWLQEAYRINIQTNYRWSQSVTLLSLGQVLIAAGRLAEARCHLEQSLQLVMSFGSKPLLEQIHEKLAALFEAEGDHERALYHHRAYHTLAITEARELANTRLGNTLDRRMKEVDLRLQLLQTRHENSQLRLYSSRKSAEMALLAHQASHDALTGTLNRRMLDEQLELLLQRSLQEGSALSLLMVDLDHFKAINDSFGHAAGDQVLRLTGRMLQQSSRNNDLVARYGGEEFMMLLPGADEHTAQIVAERVRQKIQNADWASQQEGLRVTTSIGVATLQEHDDPASLQQRADKALYRAKSGGRNRVEFEHD
ncbi:GGDEF domain-containing protein [Chitinilyticum piscinae]|uniref:diguanylate cyclase n=1 Tax=Chitinilyticum piscinae TaxID=2866724 RepID=A0A8J7KGT0_9NEIS|nr:diguanylate cyclase [Chitinilyticum piscinae]MBE9610674.1 diguanylate cyclase [Chitinilyticum piscinae]